MDLKAEILKEHSKPHALKIASYACSSATHFKALMKFFMSNDYRLAQRAAWSVSWAARKQPGMIAPYFKDLVGALERTDVHDAVIRNSLRILEEAAVPEEFHGRVMNACFGFLEDFKKPLAFKVYSMTILFQLSKIYTEIRQELKLLIEANWDNATPGFKNRGKKILDSL
jgi:hypothetical protein